MYLDALISKIAALKAAVVAGSLTPPVVGSILDDLTDALADQFAIIGPGVIVPGSFSVSHGIDNAVVSFSYTDSDGVMKTGKFTVKAGSRQQAGLVTPALLESLNNAIKAVSDSLSTLQTNFNSHKAAAIVADSAGFLPLAQQRPALMDFYCKDDFRNYSTDRTEERYARRMDLTKGYAQIEYQPAEVQYTADDCIVYDVATTRFCHRKLVKIPSLTGYIHEVQFRNRWVGCEAWGELGDDGVKPDNGRAYFCNPEQQVYVFARNYGITTSRFEPIQAMAAQLAELAAKINASLNPDSAGFLPLAQQRPALMDFYCKDNFNDYPHEYTSIGDILIGDIALRLDLRKPTETDFPEEVLYTPENCIVYDAASTRFCHRKTWQHNAYGVPHTVTEFRNRWVGCEAWGDLGDDGVKPDEGRLYYCNRDNMLYPFARNYGRNTHSFAPVAGAPAGTAATLEDDFMILEDEDNISPII